jgi:hypothetical protein
VASGSATEASAASGSGSDFALADVVTFIIGPTPCDQPVCVKDEPRGANSIFKGGVFVPFIIGPILGDKPIRVKHAPRSASRLKTNGDLLRRKQTFYIWG